MKSIEIVGAPARAGYHFRISDTETGELIGEADKDDMKEGLFFCDGYVAGYAAGFNRGIESFYEKVCAKYGLEPDEDILNRLHTETKTE